MSKRLRWKRMPKETGLRRIGAAPRGSVLHDGTTEYAWTHPLGGGAFNGPLRGWYWVVPSSDISPWMNTSGNPAPDEATAKAQAMDYIKQRIAQKGNQSEQ